MNKYLRPRYVVPASILFICIGIGSFVLWLPNLIVHKFTGIFRAQRSFVEHWKISPGIDVSAAFLVNDPNGQVFAELDHRYGLGQAKRLYRGSTGSMGFGSTTSHDEISFIEMNPPNWWPIDIALWECHARSDYQLEEYVTVWADPNSSRLLIEIGDW